MIRLLFAIALSCFGVVACHASDAESSHGVVGFWQMIEDEDGGPLGGVFELRSDNTHVGYAKDCSEYPALPFHVYKGDIFVSSDVPGKGPVSVMFRPSPDGTKLTFTSPRTRNNAVHAFHKTNPCKPQP